MSKSTRLVLPVAAILLLAVLPVLGRAATPAEGTLNAPTDTKLGERATISYTGGPTGGALALQDTGAQPVCGQTPQAAPPGECDVFTLHFGAPNGYWSARSGIVSGHLEFSIDWADQPAAEEQDLDLIVTDAAGNKVASGENDSISNATPHEVANLPLPDGGDYRVIAVGIVGAVPSYKGTIRFVLDPWEKVNTRPATSIQFGPASVVDPTLFGGEPGLNAAPGRVKDWYVDWPVSSRTNIGTIHRSTDGGDTFRLLTDPMCPQRRQPGCATGGGGDTEVALSKNGSVYFANQEVLANEAACTSPDRGTTWPSERCHAVTSLDPTNDRQWLAVHDDNLAYLAATSDTGESVVRTEDGGVTWTDPSPVNGETDGSPAAPIAVDSTGGPRDGTLYIATGRGPITMNVSHDKAASFTAYPNTSQTKTGLWFAHSLFIPWMSMDSAGNLYMVWTDSGDHAVYMSTMLASAPQNAGAKLGSTWSPPVRVSIAPARSTVHSQIAAGDPGRVTIAYEGADTSSVSDNAASGTAWNVYAAVSADALCWWTHSCVGGGPSFGQTQVSHRVNHYNEICVSGLGCTANMKDRTLLDFFDVAIDADGHPGVTWTDTNNALTGGTVMFAKMVNGPSMRGSGTFRASLARNAVRGKAGDAVWPLNGSGGANFGGLDLTGQTLAPAGQTLKVTVDLASADLTNALKAGYQTQHVKYVTRWNYGNDIYFVAADYDGSQTTFYGGKVDTNDILYSPTGANTPYGVIYAKDFDVEGTMANGVVSISVPRDQVGSPKDGETLYSVQTFTIAGLDDAVQTLFTAPDTIDATPPMDVRLGAAANVRGKTVRKPSVGGGRGALPSTGTDGMVALGLVMLSVALTAGRTIRRRFS